MNDDPILDLTDWEIVEILNRVISFQPNAECSALALELALRNPAAALEIYRQSEPAPISDDEFLDLIGQVMSVMKPAAQKDFLDYIGTKKREREALQLFRWLDSKEIH